LGFVVVVVPPPQEFDLGIAVCEDFAVLEPDPHELEELDFGVTAVDPPQDDFGFDDPELMDDVLLPPQDEPELALLPEPAPQDPDRAEDEEDLLPPQDELLLLTPLLFDPPPPKLPLLALAAIKVELTIKVNNNEIVKKKLFIYLAPILPNLRLNYFRPARLE
jgi:hypothetical protein